MSDSPMRTVSSLLSADIEEYIVNRQTWGSIRSYTYVESFIAEANESDDTARVQRAIDSAVEYSTVQFDPKVTYYLRNLVITKSLTLDLNGAQLIVDPTPGTSTDGTPVFWFKGLLTNDYAVADTQINQNTYTINLASGLGANFAAKDYIMINDSQIRDPWDGNPAFRLIGRQEINMVVAVDGDTLTLSNPTEWTYTTIPTVRKFTFLKKPKIMNAGKITEVDPGGPSSSSGSGAAHIFAFTSCMMPMVENCIFDKWNVHATNFSFCIHPIIKKSQAYDPFRPEQGGHGYLVRFNTCMGGHATENYGRHVRHLVDWSQSYDGKSSHNMSLNPWGVSYYMHGVGSKRCSSSNDTVLGGETSEAWCMGNPSFNADYDFTITNPTYIGSRRVITIQTNSIGMKIINPTIYTSYPVAIMMGTGAKDLMLIGGEIEITSTTSLSRFVQAQASGGNDVEDITITDTRFKGNGSLFLDAKGTIIVDAPNMQDLNVVPDGFSGAIRIGDSVSATDVIVRGAVVDGTVERGIYISNAPSRYYEIADNLIGNGYTTFGLHLVVANNIRVRNNTIMDNGGTPISYNGDIFVAASNGAVVTGNIPDTYDRSNLKEVWASGFRVPNIKTGTAAPTASADFIGQFFIDTVSKISYQAMSAGSGAADWKQTSN